MRRAALLLAAGSFLVAAAAPAGQKPLDLRRAPYLGVRCPLSNSVACDTVGLAVWLLKPCDRLTAVVAGRPVKMVVPAGYPYGKGTYYGPRGSYFEGSVHPAGLMAKGVLLEAVLDDRYPLPSVLDECRRYFDLRGRKVFVEYVMLGDVNDAEERAQELADLLDPKVFKVNLIPYNTTGMYDGSDREAIARFKAVLDAARLPSTMRLTRRRDIAACGQLAATR